MSKHSQKSEDNFPAESPYAWSPASSLGIEEFVSKYKPSMVQNDGMKPWIWIQVNNPRDLGDTTEEDKAIMEALELLQKVTEKVEAIKNDNAIPMRSNKKTGAKSKKEIREQVQAEASSTLKEISQKYGLTCGKWLIFAPPDRIDAIWSGIARSLASGPLTTTSAFSAKVSTSPEHEVPSYQHVICVYVPDVYNKDSVIEVMKVLVRNHGVNLSGVKSDLYTLIGLDSKHPSGVPSTVWKNTALLPESEIKEMKGAYFTELASAKAAEKSDDQKGTTPRKTALKKRKRDADDPFASDDDNGGANVASGSTEGNAREGAEKVERSKTRKGKTRV